MGNHTSAFPWMQGKWRTKEEQRLQALDLILKILVPAFLLTCIVLSCKLGSFNGYLELMSRQSYASPLMALGAGFTLAYLAFQVVRTVLWWRYKPYPLPSGPLPRVTVIVPAYNEGAMVENALYSAAAADYPADRLEIICIDDGSKDDTWFYIDRAQKRFPDLIKAIRFPQNRGKKEGLYAGFTQGQGEFFVTIDSDSVIAPDTVKQVIAPMLADPQVGAVAGNVKVYNRAQSLLARMLAVRFVLAFDFLRASQSIYGAVTCTPGALSAYRKKALTPILEKWRHQTFMGLPANIGEDRALTNFVMRQGYYITYQRSAMVHTVVPESYQGLCRMYLLGPQQFSRVLGATGLHFHQIPAKTPAAAHHRLFHHPDRVSPDLPLPGPAHPVVHRLPHRHGEILCRPGRHHPDLYVLLHPPGAGPGVHLRHPLLLLRLPGPQLGATLRVHHPEKRPLADALGRAVALDI